MLFISTVCDTPWKRNSCPYLKLAPSVRAEWPQSIQMQRKMKAPSQLENEIAFHLWDQAAGIMVTHKQIILKSCLFGRIPFDIQPNDLVKPQMSDPLRWSLFLFPSYALTTALCLRPEHKGTQNPVIHIPTFIRSILPFGLGHLLSGEPWLRLWNWLIS